jgi:hypothetical protein
MKIKNQKITTQCWTGILARGPALWASPSGTAAQPAHASRRCTRAQRGHHVCGDAVVRSARLHQRRRCSAPGWYSTGERRRLCRARWSGGVLTGDGRQRWAEKTARRGGVPRRRRSSGGQGGHRRVLQLKEGTGEVRHGPKGVDERGMVELTEGGGDNGTLARGWHGGGSPVGRSGHEAEEREEGRRSARVRARLRGRLRGERNGGPWQRWGALYR